MNSGSQKKRGTTRISSGAHTAAGAGAFAARKRPRQARSKQMVDAVLQAAAELFGEYGYARTTTNKIARRAGVSVGSLYQYFPNKDSLLAGLVARHHAEVHEVVERALVGLANPAIALDDGIRRMLSELVAVHEADPLLTRALSAANLRESPAVHQLEEKADHGSQHRLVCAVLASRPDVREGDHTVMSAVLGQTLAQLARWLVHDAPAELDREALAGETVELLVRFLRA